MEGVILVAIVVLICAIAVPNLRSALQRDRQKRSVTAMRSLGAALESYRASTGGYPASEGGGAAALASLAPREMSAPPLQDSWHRPFSYIAVAQAGATLPTTYTLISYGKDGIYQGFQNEITRYFDCDLIFADGQFVQSSEGFCCVVSGTPVETPRGQVLVEQLTLDQEIVGRSGNGVIGPGRVTAICVRRTNKYLRLSVEGGRLLELTAEHRVWSSGRWAYAGNLRPGDVLFSVTGPARLLAVERVGKSAVTYDLTVADNANFFAGGVLVHNKK